MQPAAWSEIILHSMSDGVLTLDDKGIVTGLNPAAAEILDLDPEQTVGQPYAATFFMLPGNDDFNQILLDLVSSGETSSYTEVSFHREDGAMRQLAVTSNLLSQDGQRVGLALVFKDITAVHLLRFQRNELAEELKQKHLELTKAYMDLEERNKSLHERQRRVLIIKLVGGLLGLLAFVAIILLTVGGFSDNEATVAVEDGGGQEVKLREVTSRKGDVMVTISTSGHIEPLQVVTVTARVGGEVVERFFSLGQRVRKGDLLFRLDEGEVLPKVREAEAALLRAQDKVRELRNWAQGAETQQARRSQELADLDLKNKDKRLKEAERLFKEGIIPANDLENARSDLIRAQAEAAAARERLQEARARGSQDKLKVAELELENAKASLAEAQEKLACTKITAPASGVVMRAESKNDNKTVDPPAMGAKVNEGQEMLAVGADNPLGVVTPVSESDIGRVVIGQRALVTTQALAGKVLEAKVLSVAPQADTSRKQPTFPVVVEMDQLPPDVAKNLRLGMSAAVRIVVAEAKDAVLLPIVAVSKRPEGMAVRIKKDDELVWQQVSTGLNDHEFVQITKGLEPGQTVYF